LLRNSRNAGGGVQPVLSSRRQKPVMMLLSGQSPGAGEIEPE